MTTTIATGAIIPKGANAVVMVEDTDCRNDMLYVYHPVVPGENISYAGQDITGKLAFVLIAGFRCRYPLPPGARRLKAHISQFKRLENHLTRKLIERFAANPSKQPAMTPIATEVTPAINEIRVPQMTRVRTSRPLLSVPSGCTRLGVANAAPRSCLIGSYGEMSGAPNAITVTPMTMMPPNKAKRALNARRTNNQWC